MKYNKNDYSYEANEVIRTYYSITTIIDIKESLIHDGCDHVGFKSDIWDLDITFKNNNNQELIANWHYENWFCNNNENQYYFCGNTFK